MHKLSSTKRIEPKKLIQCTTNNLNSIASQKYSVSPYLVENNLQKMHQVFFIRAQLRINHFLKRQDIFYYKNFY